MIKVSEPLLIGNEKKYLCEAIDQGEVSSGGSFVRRFEEAFAKWSGNDYAVAVSSGTAALETAVWSSDIKYISIPSGTIISCYTASVRADAFVNLRDNMSSSLGTIMRCNLFGQMEWVSAEKIVDDNSQYWKPFRVQNVGCYSLYANKLITSGEGGVLVTNDKEVYEKALSYRNLCHGEERFVHKHLGYNFRMSNLQAAVALAQLEQIDNFIEIKQRNRDLYLKHLDGSVFTTFDVEVPWMYIVESSQPAGYMVHELQKHGIECRRFFYPIHRQPCVSMDGFFPVADHLWNYAFYLPSGLNLTEKDIIYVSDKVRGILSAV